MTPHQMLDEADFQEFVCAPFADPAKSLEISTQAHSLRAKAMAMIAAEPQDDLLSELL